MKIKFLTVLSLGALLLLAGCRGADNANTTNINVRNTNTNSAATPMMTATPVAQTNEAATADPAMKKKVEDALKAKGYTDVTIDMSTSPATLRGSVAKDKMTEVVATAQEALGKPVRNEMSAK